MLRKTVTAAVMVAFAGVAGFEYASMPASAAMPYAPMPPAVANPDIQQAAVWVYVPNKHGKRYKKKYPGYGYYYNGWWYAKPWWKYGGPRVWVYDPGLYGPRYKVKKYGYPYYYKGYYYKRPWWKY
ncbi:MAG: hypothetical protein JNM20_03985 [Rhizobiales bacterium]|nr:hypothetical protein [Hyphomicrobiales bacterium]